MFFGKSPGHHGSKKNAAYRTNGGTPKTYVKSPEDGCIQKNGPVTFQGKFAGKPIYTTQHGIPGIVEGKDEGIPYRVEGQETEDQHSQDNQNIAKIDWFFLSHCSFLE
jgi:hypothetical protein